MKPKKPTPNVLIVDDQPLDLQIPLELTMNLGYNPVLAFDGMRAFLETQRAHFDCIILDWNMPGVNGHEFLKLLEKENAKAQNPRVTSVILHSGESLPLEDSFFAKAKSFRILDVWPKPMRTLEMLKRLKIINELYGRSA